MKVKESTFWNYIKKHFDKLGVLYDRIEPVSKPGIPDVNAIYKGKEIWIELKSESGLQINIKPWQTKWAQRRSAAGSNCYLLVKRITSKYDQLELFKMDQDLWCLQKVVPKTGSTYLCSDLIDIMFS